MRLAHSHAPAPPSPRTDPLAPFHCSTSPPPAGTLPHCFRHSTVRRAATARRSMPPPITVLVRCRRGTSAQAGPSMDGQRLRRAACRIERTFLLRTANAAQPLPKCGVTYQLRNCWEPRVAPARSYPLPSGLNGSQGLCPPVVDSQFDSYLNIKMYNP